jgi:hypothetical protein
MVIVSRYVENQTLVETIENEKEQLRIQNQILKKELINGYGLSTTEVNDILGFHGIEIDRRQKSGTNIIRSGSPNDVSELDISDGDISKVNSVNTTAIRVRGNQRNPKDVKRIKYVINGPPCVYFFIISHTDSLL